MKRYTKLFLSFLILTVTLLFFGVTTSNTVVVGASYDSYYTSVNTSSGENLLSTLHTIISSKTKDLGYKGLLSAYRTTDCKPGTNIIWDMYSNEEFVCGGDKENHNYSKEGDGYNREHSVPQSWFSEKSPMKSDLFHVYPTDGYVNNRRGNYPYGEVGSATYTSKNGSKLGSSSFSGYSGTVFEPIDEYKGDFARTYFYMATRYSNLVGNWGSGASTVFKGTYPYLTTYAVNLFTKWSKLDPVSEKETLRNDAVYQLQNNRNPFIDHPEYIDKIWGSPVDPTPVDQTKIDNAISKINLIPTNVTLECKSVVLEAKSAYDACSATEKALVTNSSKLTNAINTINKLENAGKTDSFNEKEYIIPTDEFAYTKDKTIIIDGDEFNFNCAGAYKDKDTGVFEFRVGGNANNSCKASSIFNLGSVNAGEMYMDFDVEDASKISFNVTKIYQVDKWYIFFSNDEGTTYTKVAEGNGSDTTYEASLTTPETGRFALVITSSKAPRAAIDKFTISTASFVEPLSDYSKITTNLNLSVKYKLDNDGNFISASATVNAIAHLTEVDDNATYGVIYTKSSNLNYSIEGYYESETVEALASKVNGTYKEVTPTDNTLKVNIGEVVEDYTIVFVINVGGKLYFTSQTTNNTKNMIKYYLDNNLITNDAYKTALQFLA